MNLIKQIPYIIILFLIIVIAVKDCGGGKGKDNIIESDTTYTTTIDSLYNVIQGMKKVDNPTMLNEKDLEPEVITKYITKTKECDKPHLIDKGINILKYRQYRDTVNIKGYFVSYDMNVIGELQGIKLGLNGNVPTIRQSTVRTVNTTIEKNNSLGAYFNYNRSLQLGLEYRQKNLSYSLNYDLEYQSLGVKIGYHPFNF